MLMILDSASLRILPGVRDMKTPLTVILPMESLDYLFFQITV